MGPHPSTPQRWFPRWPRSINPILAGSIVDGIAFGAALPTVPFALLALGAGPVAVAGLFSVQSLGLALGLMVFGYMSDRSDPKTILVVCLCLRSAAYWGVVFASTKETLLMSWFVMSFMGGSAVVMTSIVASYRDGDGRRRGLAMLAATGSAGFILGPLVVASISAFAGANEHQRPLYFGATISLLVPFFLLRLNTTTPPVGNASNETQDRMRLSWFGDGWTLRLMAYAFMFACGTSVLLSTTAIWTERNLGWGPTEVSLTLVLGGVLLLVTQLFLVWRPVADHTAGLLTTATMSIVGLVILVWFRSTTAFLVCCSLIAIAIGGVGVILPNAVAEVRSARTGSRLAAVETSQTAAAILAPLAYGVILDLEQEVLAFIVAATCVGVAMLTLLRLNNYSRVRIRHFP